MGRRPRKLLLKGLRITIGLALIGWGIISAVIFILPGGIWTILLGLGILAIDLPWVKTIDDRLKAWVEKKYPRFYRRAFLPIYQWKENMFAKIRSWLGGKED